MATKEELFDFSHFDINAILRGAQLTLVGAQRALQNPGLWTTQHYRQAVIAVGCGIVIRLLVEIPIIALRIVLWVLGLFMELDAMTWDDSIVDGLRFLQSNVLQVPLFMMSLMRHITPAMDELFMLSLQWVDHTYAQKHEHERPDGIDPHQRYYENLRQYGDAGRQLKRQGQGQAQDSSAGGSGLTRFLKRFARKTGISLAVYALSFLPVVGRFVLPAASFYTFRHAVGLGPAAVVFLGGGLLLPRRYLVVFIQTYYGQRSLMRELLGPYFSRVSFSAAQKRSWFHSREGLLFGFGAGFYMMLRVPFFGVFIYGIAEASTAYLVTKITDPPPAAAVMASGVDATSAVAVRAAYADGQQQWRNKKAFLELALDNLDAMQRQHGGTGSKIVRSSSSGNDTGSTAIIEDPVKQPTQQANTVPETAVATMGKTGIRTITKVSFDKPAWEQPGLHNRWHPDIPFSGTIQDGETVKIECLDWTGGQIGNNDSADDLLHVDLTRIHYLSGPFEISGAQPGDLLLIEIMDVQPFEDQPWGFTGVFDRHNGGGFLDEIYPTAAKAIWDFEGISCSSRHIPHVKFAGLIHPGILGCAPSAEVLATWNKREGELIAASELADRDVALPPQPLNAHAGAADAATAERIGREGARTVPGRPEHGGNCDIKNLSRGSKVYLPVHVAGAKFSVGDLHFSQGDGEISFCGAIEMAGIITINFKVIKNGMADLSLKSPIYIPGPVEPQFGPGRYIYFEGFSVDQNGKQHYMDVTVAYRQTILRCIEYLRRFGYNDYQIYLLLSCAPVQGHVAGIVDIPNACTTLGLPHDIFDFDIGPEAGAAKKLDMGSCAYPTGVTDGVVLAGSSNSKTSFGGGLTYKE
ncbi:formamidase [Grosmannia clavigera kw1407]|uniref:Formamidase n=1 Tax=Grosmannia clavigera (strain kw1407 / UAMH 11150) TaxID=655863 RepID=F0X8X0_GROCL|nr:formamidase [Grosmannia clavigera kw1407]EFX05585.1 formamidase [Grosmannia clavigera kw1407]